MSRRTTFWQMISGVLIVAALTASGQGQVFNPRIGSYLGPYYWGPYGNMSIGSYLPYQPLPPWPYIVPPAQLIPQPYPYFYQPPLYVPPPYFRPYYPPPWGPRYYYYYYWHRRPYAHPRHTPQPSPREQATPKAQRNSAPTHNDLSLKGFLKEAERQGNPPADPNVETP